MTDLATTPMGHLTMEQLLALREPGAEPGDAAARAHAEACERCRGELDRLHQRVARLKALPTLRPARDRWPMVRDRLAAERRRHRLRRVRWAGLVGLAAAASIALGVVVRHDLVQPATATAAELQAVQQRSQALEQAIHQYDPDARVVDGRTAQVAQELEDRIAELDRRLEMVELGQPAPAVGRSVGRSVGGSVDQSVDQEVLQLWRERVGLLDALVDVHVTRASQVGL